MVQQDTWKRNQNGRPCAHLHYYFFLIDLLFDDTRLNSILAKRNLAASKLDEIKIKVNILKSFLEERAAAEESKEKLARAESEL